MNWLDFIVSKRGQWEHPGELTAVPTDNGIITMKGVPYPVMGFVPGQPPVMMQPDKNYKFPGKMVYEIPVPQYIDRGWITPQRPSTAIKWPTVSSQSTARRYPNPMYFGYGGDISIPDLSRPNWLDKAQKGQQVKYYDDLKKFNKANKAYEDSLSAYNAYPIPKGATAHNISTEEFLRENNQFLRNTGQHFSHIGNAFFASSAGINPAGIEPVARNENGYNYVGWEWVYKKPTQKPVYKEKPKEYIPTKTPRLEREPLQLVIPQSDRTLMPYNNTRQVLRGVQQEDKSNQNLYPTRVVPAPEFQKGGVHQKIYTDPLQFAAANKAYNDSLGLATLFPLPPKGYTIYPYEYVDTTGFIVGTDSEGNDIVETRVNTRPRIEPIGYTKHLANKSGKQFNKTTGKYEEFFGTQRPIYKAPTEEPVYQENSKVESIPYREDKVELSDKELAPITYMPPSNTAVVLSQIKEEDLRKQGPKNVPAPTFKAGGRLDRYQEGKEVKEETYRTPWWNPEKPSEWNPAWTSDPTRQRAQVEFSDTYVLPTVEITDEKPQRFKDQEAAASAPSQQVRSDKSLIDISNLQDPTQTYEDFLRNYGNRDAIRKFLGEESNSPYYRKSEAVNDTIINLTDKPMGWFNFNTYPGKEYTDILGNNYIETDRSGTGRPEDYAKNWKTRMQDPNDIFRNPDYAKEAGSYYHSKDIPAFYGIENDRIKVGKPEDFNENTVIVPVRNSTTPYAKVDVEKGLMHDNYYTYDKEGNKMWNLDTKTKFLVHSPETGQTIFISNKDNPKFLKTALDEFQKTNPGAYIISMDEGRFDTNLSSQRSKKASLDEEDFRRWTGKSGNVLEHYLENIDKPVTDRGNFTGGPPIYSPVGDNRFGYNLGILKQKHGGAHKWLDNYQGDEGSSQVERRDPNQPFFPSATEAGTYESQYSLPEASVTPNWTEAELERNRLRDKYIADDKKAFRHWYDKLGYDKDNVTKRANQFAYNKLAKQYLKGDKDKLTEEQRKFIEKSEYANRLQPSIGSRFVEGVTNPGFNLETLGNLAAPFEYPANLVRGAVKGEFTDALKGQTPSPYFVSSDLAGTSPTEAAIASGLVDVGVDTGIAAFDPTSLVKKAKATKKLPGSPNSGNIVDELREELQREGIVQSQKTLNLPWKNIIRKGVRPWAYDIPEKTGDIHSLIVPRKNPSYIPPDEIRRQYEQHKKFILKPGDELMPFEEYMDQFQDQLFLTRGELVNNRFNKRFAKENPQGFKNRYATWDMYLGKPQTENPMYDISHLTKSKDDVVYTIKEDFMDKPMVQHELSRMIDDIESGSIKGANIGTSEHPRYRNNVPKKRGDNKWIMLDQDNYFGTMGGFHWDIKKLPNGNYEAYANDVWDLQPFKGKGLRNFEIGKTLGIGKPLNVKVGFEIDKDTKKIIKTYGMAPGAVAGAAALQKEKYGGLLEQYQDGSQVPANFFWIDQDGQFRDVPIPVPPPKTFEEKVDDFLGNPQEKAMNLNRRINNDNLRHSAASMHTTESLGSTLGAAILAQGLGAAHEISSLPKRIQDTKTDDVGYYDNIYHNVIESGEDVFNNAIGSMVGMIPFIPTKAKESLLVYLSNNNMLPDGKSMPEGNEYVPKKKSGGWLDNY